VEEKEPLIPIEGTPPSLVNLPTGCPFEPRCPISVELCRTTEPPLAAHRPGRLSACHYAEQVPQLKAELQRAPKLSDDAPGLIEAVEHTLKLDAALTHAPKPDEVAP
jgi:peptide/nickel transport system ATP-binding protein